MSKKSNLISFKPAKICQGAVFYVEFYCVNPFTDRLERKRIKLNHIKSIPERKKFAEKLVKEINAKLYDGWNVFEEERNPRGFRKLVDVMNQFISEKEKELRIDSIRSYKSYIEILSVWLDKNKKLAIASENFRSSDAMDFMDYVYNERNASNTTWNNYRLFFSTLWNWLKAHEYVSKNHFEKMPRKNANEKERIIIDLETREMIKNHLERTDYNFLIVSLLVFHALIRPKEIAHLKPSYFNLEKQIIRIPSSVSKNRTERLATIPDDMMKYLLNWNFNMAGANQYIFSQSLLPGPTPIDARSFTKKWDKLRNDLCLDTKMKLYSLRDSGIIQMLQDGISPEEVMKQADHSSLEITTIYVKHANPSGSEQIKKKGSKF
jgi:integrase